MQRKLSYQLKRLVALLSLISFSIEATGGEKPDGKEVSPQVLDERVEHHLRRMQKHFESLKSFSADAELTAELQINGKVHSNRKRLRIKFRRPNQFFIEANGKVKFACDGEVMRLVTENEKKYLEKEAPANFRSLDQIDMFQSMTGSSLSQVLASLFFAEEMRDSLLKGVQRADYHVIGNGTIHCLKFYKKDSERQVWLPNEAPLPDQLIVKEMRRRRAARGSSISINSTLSLQFSGWEENPEIDENEFKIPPAKNGQRFVSILDSTKSDKPVKPDPLLGKQSPNVSLETLKGEKVNLSQHIGNDIVVINFWSTTSATSRFTMPIFARIQEKFRDRGIVVYGIAVRDEPTELQVYLESTKNDIGAILVDKDGKVAEAYGQPFVAIVAVVECRFADSGCLALSCHCTRHFAFLEVTRWF